VARLLNAWRPGADEIRVGEPAMRADQIAPRAEGLPGLAEALPRVCELFSELGTVGLVLVDGTPLLGVERSHGHAAYERSVLALGELVQDACEGFEGGRFVVRGETGRPEVAVLLLRRQDDARLYRGELAELSRDLVRALDQQGHRVAYPYLRRAPNIGVGFAVGFRNPFYSPETQIRRAFAEAREDADVCSRVAARARRKKFLSLVLGGDVSSVYEPIVDVATKTVFGYEALARGPAGTEFHSPAALFEAAEEEGFVFELDCLCRRSGLRGAEDLPTGTKLFLNVRPTTIYDPNFRPEALIRTLARTQLQPSDVVFEISEQESIQSFDAFREVRDEYGKLGFQIAIDDTGAGYASLQAVMELEPDYIKVDRAFCSGIDTDPARQSMLSALHSVAGQIGARIIAEGLDTLEELETLGRLGIPFGQGWLFGKPTPLRAG
jgi:EAL domain-containing protein (putative c-di-GMP-specific phosphodiesterase class I)